MPTPTTVKFQIAVSSTNTKGEATEKTYTLTLSFQVEGSDEGEIRVTPILATGSDSPEGASTEGDLPDGTLQPAGDVPLPKDPPVH